MDTLENKAKFFAQYYNQFVMKIPNNEDSLRVFDQWIISQSTAWLELKPLENISDEDLKAIGFGNIGDKKIQFYFNDYNCQWSSSCGNYGSLLLQHYDYLRSKGYALPWNGVSVGWQIEYGWIKLNKIKQ